MDMFTWEPSKARLDKQGKVNAWTAGHSDQSQWLQVLLSLSILFSQCDWQPINFPGATV